MSEQSFLPQINICETLFVQRSSSCFCSPSAFAKAACCASSLAFLRSNFVLLVIISFLCLMKAWSISFKLTSLGWPSTRTVKLIPKDCSNWV